MTGFPKNNSKKKPSLGGSKKARDKVRRSTAHEHRVAEKVGGWRNPGSGNQRGDKWASGDRRGDVRCPDLIIEAKRTEKKSYRITEEVISKAWAEALNEGKDWALAIEIQGFERKVVPSKLILIDEDTYARLLELARKAEEQESISGSKA